MRFLTEEQFQSEKEKASESALRWFLDQEHYDVQKQDSGIKDPVTESELSDQSIPLPPEWYLRDREYQYRKGFYNGILEAARLVQKLYREGGYTRPSEISSMLDEWVFELDQWKVSALHEPELSVYGSPDLDWKPWAEIKYETHERDGWRCTECGSAQKLECHHVYPVREGGLPVLENLTTLCKECHQKV